MVFGNMGDDLGHRRRLHPQSFDGREGALRRVPGQRPGRGRRRRHPHARRTSPRRRASHAGSDKPSLQKLMPEAFASFVAISDKLEKHYRDMQDLEFTIERGKLWMLQTRSGKRTAKAALEGRRRHGQRRADHAGGGGGRASTRPPLDQLLHPTIDPKAARDVIGRRPAGFAGGGDRRDRVLPRTRPRRMKAPARR